jgi:hypothetical protein
MYRLMEGRRDGAQGGVSKGWESRLLLGRCDSGGGWRQRAPFGWVREPVGEVLRADGIVGDPRRSLVGREILCVDEPVRVGATDGDLGLGWCGTAAGRGEEAWACAA